MEEEDKQLNETKQLLRSLLLPEKKGLILTALEKEYLGHIGCEIPYKSFGFQNSVAFLESISDAVQVQRLSDGKNVLCTAVADQSVRHIR